jgi:hypothetical protein
MQTSAGRGVYAASAFANPQADRFTRRRPDVEAASRPRAGGNVKMRPADKVIENSAGHYSIAAKNGGHLML